MGRWSDDGSRYIDHTTELMGSNPQDAKAPGNGDVNALHSGFNGATWDRWRNNQDGILLASATRTANTSSTNNINYNCRGIMVQLNVTAASGTGGLKTRVVGVVNGISFILAEASTNVTTTGKFLYELYPGIGTAATGEVTVRTSGSLPRVWFVQIQHADATSYTYSAGYSLIV